VESYNKEIAENPKVEMIHLSLDQDEDAAEAWAKKENMPWPTLVGDDKGKDTLTEKYGVRAIPSYILVDRSGNKIAEGKGPAFAKVKETSSTN
jgi:thioredoxin-related protein